MARSRFGSAFVNAIHLESRRPGEVAAELVEVVGVDLGQLAARHIDLPEVH